MPPWYRAIARIEIPPLDTERGAARAMAGVVVVQRDTIDELRGVRPPDELAGTVQKWIALLDQSIDELELVVTRLRGGAWAAADTYAGNASKLLARRVTSWPRTASLRAAARHSPPPEPTLASMAPAGGYDRLTALDESFLHLERPETPMHVGAVAVLEREPFYDADGRFRLDDVRSLVAVPAASSSRASAGA